MRSTHLATHRASVLQQLKRACCCNHNVKSPSYSRNEVASSVPPKTLAAASVRRFICGVKQERSQLGPRAQGRNTWSVRPGGISASAAAIAAIGLLGTFDVAADETDLPSPPRLEPRWERLKAMYGDQDRMDEFAWVRRENESGSVFAAPIASSLLSDYLAQEWEYAERALSDCDELRFSLEQEISEGKRLYSTTSTTVNDVDAVLDEHEEQLTVGVGDAVRHFFGLKIPHSDVPAVVCCSRADRWAHGDANGENATPCPQCRVVLDADKLIRAYCTDIGSSGRYFKIPAIQVSPDGRLAALLVDANGHERFDLLIAQLDIDSQTSETPTYRVIASACGSSFAWISGPSPSFRNSNAAQVGKTYSLLHTSLEGLRQQVLCTMISELPQNSCKQGASWLTAANVAQDAVCEAKSSASHFEIWESRSKKVVFVSEATRNSNSLRFVEKQSLPSQQADSNSAKREGSAGEPQAGWHGKLPLRFVRPPNNDETVDAQDWGDDFFILHVSGSGGYSSIRYCKRPPAHIAQKHQGTVDGKESSEVVSLDGWERAWDESFGCFYFHHKQSGVSLWDLPQNNLEIAQMELLGIGQHAFTSQSHDEEILIEFCDNGSDLSELPLAPSRALFAESMFVTERHLAYLRRTNHGHVDFVWHRVSVESREIEATSTHSGVGRTEKHVVLGRERVLSAAKLSEKGTVDEELLLKRRLTKCGTAANHGGMDLLVENQSVCPVPIRADPVPASAGRFNVGTSNNDARELVRITWSTFDSPRGAVRLDLDTGATSQIQQPKSLSEEAPSLYAQVRVWVRAPRNVPASDTQPRESSDSTIYVPVSLVFRRDCARLDGSCPAVVRVYGCYGAADPLVFRAADVPLLDRGVIVAHVHVRGGGELGSYWHDEGRMLLKRNSISDLRACLEALQGIPITAFAGGSDAASARTLSKGLVARGQVALHGFSAGGLVAAALANSAPHLVDVLVLESPFLDLLNSMLDPSLPLVVGERTEWCDPLASQECYFYLKSYSPYETICNIASDLVGDREVSATGDRGALPPREPIFPDTLVTASMHDARVMFWEPIKYTNRLRRQLHALQSRLLVDEQSYENTVVLLRMLTQSRGGGHAENHNQSFECSDEAFIQAFVLSRLCSRAERDRMKK